MAERQSIAESLFSEIMGRPAGERSAFLRAMVHSTPPTFEDEWLDFKSGFGGPTTAPVDLSDDNIKELWSTALAGFANTGGGLLIWGIDARPAQAAGRSKKKVDAASGLRLVPHPDALKSQLMQLHHTATDPPIQGIRVEPVDDDKEPGGFVVCLIPESKSKPHRAQYAAGNPYFMRIGDDFVNIPHAILRSMFFPHAKPRYTVHIDCRARNLDNATVTTFDFRLNIQNVGNATAGDPFVLLQLQPPGAPGPQTFHSAYWKFSMVPTGFGYYGNAPIHPGSVTPTIQANFPKSGWNTEPGIRLTCVVHSLNAEPSRFAAIFDVEDLLNGMPKSLDADELTE